MVLVGLDSCQLSLGREEKRSCVVFNRSTADRRSHQRDSVIKRKGKEEDGDNNTDNDKEEEGGGRRRRRAIAALATLSLCSLAQMDAAQIQAAIDTMVAAVAALQNPATAPAARSEVRRRCWIHSWPGLARLDFVTY